MFTLEHRDLILHLFSIITEPTTFLNLLQLNKLFYNIGKEHIPIKRKQFLKFVRKELTEYYILPNGKREGLYKRYYEQGPLASEHYYLQGKLHGLYRTWFPWGQLQLERHYHSGKKHGVERKWYANGQLAEKCRYVANKLRGQYHAWYPNGKLKRECSYINEYGFTMSRKWSEDGKVVGEYISQLHPE